MAAFRITINGKPCCGSEVTALTLVAEDVRRRDEQRISLHARGDAEGPLQCLTADLHVGDEIVIRITEEEEADAGPRGCHHGLRNLVQGLQAAICDDCVAAFAAAVRNGEELPPGASIHDEPDRVCGFCGKQPGEVPGVVVRGAAAVCPECLRACSDLID